jgi:hypothetical protein
MLTFPKPKNQFMDILLNKHDEADDDAKHSSALRFGTL